MTGDGTTAFGVCWDLGDVLFDEESEIMTSDGITQHVTLVPGIRWLVRSLAGRGVPMAVVSDTRVGACENVLGTHGLLDCFSHWSISEALGVEKPHPKMFTSAAEGLGIPPNRLAMIGNNYARDIEGASAVGMTAIWFRWNSRYPAPDQTPAARYVARDAHGLAQAIAHWCATLPAASRATEVP